MEILKSFFTKPSNTGDSLKAKILYDEICGEYEQISINYAKNGIFKIIMDDSTKYPHDDYRKQVLENLMKAVKDSTVDLTHIAIYISSMSTFSKIHFKCFEIEKIDDWYKGLKK